MNLYNIAVIEQEIESRAKDNDGEISEEDLKSLVEAQTKSIEKIENLCKYIRHLEQFEEKAKAEIARINGLKQGATNRMQSIKKYLTPYVKGKGKFDAGTFRLSIRTSKSADVISNFDVPGYMKESLSITPDKVKIKEDLKKGVVIPGARLSDNDNLQIK